MHTLAVDLLRFLPGMAVLDSGVLQAACRGLGTRTYTCFVMQPLKNYWLIASYLHVGYKYSFLFNSNYFQLVVGSNPPKPAGDLSSRIDLRILVCIDIPSPGKHRRIAENQ